METEICLKDESLHETGIYLYGVVRRSMVDIPLDVEGVQHGEKVKILPAGCLALVVGCVSVHDFTPRVLDERLKAGETQWAKEKAMAHAAVLQELLRRGPVLPVRFGTIFRDMNGLLSIIGLQEEKLIPLLDKLEGKAEWGVRIHCREEVLKASLMEDEPEARLLKESIKSMPEGTAYLYKMRLEMLLENKAQSHLIQWTQQIHDALAGISEKAVELTNHDQRQDSIGGVQMVIFNEAYLVQDKDTGHFRDELEKLGNAFEARGLHFYVSGPWPPYNFAPLRLDVETR